jgi:hypothetical protein
MREAEEVESFGLPLSKLLPLPGRVAAKAAAAFHHPFHDCCTEPRRSGADTGGPPRSVQLMMNAPQSVAHKTSTRPFSLESAPYFPALLASS